MKPIIWVVLSFLLNEGKAFQEEDWGARNRGLAHIAATIQSELSCLGENCAGLAPLRDMTFTVSFVPSVYGLTELSSRMFLAAVPTPVATFAGGVRDFGFDLYRESSLLVGSGFGLTEGAFAGLGAEFKNIRIRGYGSQTVVFVNAGVQFTVGDKILLGGNISNVLGATIGKDRERIPRSASFGFSFSASEDARLAFEVEKDTRNPEVLKSGIEFHPLQFLTLRAGVKDGPLEWAFGISCDVSFLVFVYGGSYHGDLGWIHQVEASMRVSI